jgi:radical SAM superfamily enzyme YgiQ (UPF0313 family)
MSKKYQLPPEKGPTFHYNRGSINVGFFNANPYRIGIAHLGSQVIRHYLLERKINVSVAYADTLDDSKFLWDDNFVPIQSDIIAVSATFETTYVNVLKMLKQTGIPLRREHRKSDHPVVIGGGMINPMPMTMFFDAVVLGEGRDAMIEIIKKFEGGKNQRLSRDEIIESFSEIEGIYVPSLYKLEYDTQGYVDSFEAPTEKEYIFSRNTLDLNEHPIYSIWTSPVSTYDYTDYLSIMVAMGCHKKCPFCVVGNLQSNRNGKPLIINEESVIELAEKRREKYGTQIIKLFFSSAYSKGEIDRTGLLNLISKLLSQGFKPRVGSLNIKQVDKELLRLIRHAGQNTVTIAPETNHKLRRFLGKGYITDDNLMEISRMVSKYGLNLALYTMSGIPGETDDDIVALGTLVSRIRREMGNHGVLLVHHNQVYIKPHVPWQHLENISYTEARRKYNILVSSIGNLNGIKMVTCVNSEIPYVQPILARGNDLIGKVIERVFLNNNYSIKSWKQALDYFGLDDIIFLKKRIPKSRLPWSHFIFRDDQRAVSLNRLDTIKCAEGH